ncbi:E3 ubiquitin-protein ligase SIAH1 isoform X3 [Amblyraja radiata]|uniref:E3 ubiquitin-protein ligase SIAH1 isoform X3 n=1 Tax=Amblyraja radiata TaxID=386614 RepID=UPI001403C524|nr:E3 ubiquitin-protein ligase SIAH1 isoform X3 [Amblyraja radiata]
MYVCRHKAILMHDSSPTVKHNERALCFCLTLTLPLLMGFARLGPASLEMSRQTATALPTGTSKCTPAQRVPALTGTTASNSDLASLFECPVCFDYVLPPILQCQSGHLVCSNCRPKLTCCPTCRGPLGSIRNLAMEKVANSVLFPYIIQKSDHN